MGFIESHQVGAEVEERFNIKIPFEKVPYIKKVGDFLEYIRE